MWVVDQILAGKRQRRYFATELEAAWYHANSTVSVLHHIFEGEDRVWEPTTADCVKVIVSALESYPESVKPAQPVSSSVPLSQAILECIASKKETKCRDRYVKNLQGVLKNFSKGREAAPINTITTADVETFIKPAKSAGTRASLTNRVSALFSFAVNKKWIATNPVDSIARPKIETGTPTILTVEQAAQLMTIVETKFPDILANIVLKLFAAVRPEEAVKLTDENVQLDEGIVVIPASASKVRQRRIVHLQPSAIEWLKRAKKLNSPVPISIMTSRRRMASLAEAMGFDGWPQDVLRHSAISYWVAECRSIGEVAMEAGTSEKIIKKNYLNMVTRTEATKFWTILPN